MLHNNNNNEEGSRENHSWTASMAEQTRCVLCGVDCADFAAVEAHCQTEHARSPCMYCPKTFAQKANRDRHMCLHTGDRPYGCPECGERFSRGDKLKAHRVRMHGVLYPLCGGSRGGGPRDRIGADWAASSTSQSPAAMIPNCVDLAGAVINGSSQDESLPPVPAPEATLHGSTTVMSGGEWIDLRVSMCPRPSTKLQSALLAGVTSPADQQTIVETFPTREVTDDELASRE